MLYGMNFRIRVLPASFSAKSVTGFYMIKDSSTILSHDRLRFQVRTRIGIIKSLRWKLGNLQTGVFYSTLFRNAKLLSPGSCWASIMDLFCNHWIACHFFVHKNQKISTKSHSTKKLQMDFKKEDSYIGGWH